MKKGIKIPNTQLRFQRENRGWTQKKVADLLDTSKDMISRWECGERVPGKYYQERLCQIFTMTANELGFLPRHPYPLESHLVTPGEQLEHPTIDNLTRRALLSHLVAFASVPAISLEWMEHLLHPTSLPSDHQEMTTLEQSLENSWELCNAGEWHIAEHILQSFFPSLLQQASQHHLFARAASQALILQSIMCAHQFKLAAMIPLCKQAVLYARYSQDQTTLCMALNGLAVSFKYNRQLHSSFLVYQEALHYCDQASPLVRSRTLAGAASAYAQTGQFQQADALIQSAYECYPKDPQRDLRRLSADHGGYMLAYYAGLVKLEAGQPQEALHAFARYNTLNNQEQTPQRNYLEIINHMGKAAIRTGNLERYVEYAHRAFQGALELQSKKRLDEATQIFTEEVPSTWRKEARIQHLLDHYPMLTEAQR